MVSTREKSRKEAGKARLGPCFVIHEAGVGHFFITGVFCSDLSEVTKLAMSNMVIWIQFCGFQSSFSTLNFTVSLFIKVIPRSLPANVRVMRVTLFSTDSLDFVTQWLEEASNDLLTQKCKHALPAGGGAAGSGDAPPLTAVSIQNYAYLKLLKWDHFRRPFPEVGAAGTLTIHTLSQVAQVFFFFFLKESCYSDTNHVPKMSSLEIVSTLNSQRIK